MRHFSVPPGMSVRNIIDKKQNELYKYHVNDTLVTCDSITA